MIRKVKKADLDRFTKETGVRVKYAEKPPEKSDQKQEVVLTIPEGMLAPLINVIGTLLATQQQTQAMLTEALSTMAGARDINIQVTDRDSQGNIKDVSVKNQVRH